MVVSEDASNRSLESVAKHFGIDGYVINNPCQGDKVARTTLASTVEALLGAVWLDTGRDYAKVRDIVHDWGIGFNFHN